MTVEDLLKQLEADIKKAESLVQIHKNDYDEANKFSDPGEIAYFYAQYERSLRELDKLRSAINIIKERVA